MNLDNANPFPYPRFLKRRAVFRFLSKVAFSLLSDLEIIGQENLPQGGPLIIVANHFHFGDTAAIVRATPWPLEFLGGFFLIDAPFYLKWIPNTWGYYRVRRGAASRDAMRASLAVLEQHGVLMLFPEGGSWAEVLRPARPGAAYIATRSGAPILPIGFDGIPNIFRELPKGRRAKVTIRIGKPFGPFTVDGRGRDRRDALEEIGHEIMRQIKALIPPEKHGIYSDDPVLREAAQEAAVYPYDDLAQTGPPDKPLKIKGSP
ncbi:MAG: 1-acyl-sn-glycerol-3-phosphate acyltransferase [Ardenticatenaceae bacterium]|nr:1-acyl-sn-glycerol-3-phosphate acyltransferase [Anaerolineales bacterium]MCB8920723.1 1-acyl-sn-glycerol-3-phosphate acyltransferase [Ardenticatenaceae bacterium]MCB8989682.1 1-acyl-sn-glycerol-3-phosphate acyltransferase [Ardenticatenaceae bacterium]MCB9002859.1 1-acyl-sn-glycerol-3-phosphate acyltransferase [Ardenticatenaceae bacterium]